MKHEIENKLFVEFESGAACMCLDYILTMRVNKCNISSYPQTMQEYYTSILGQVKERTEAFDDIAWPLNVRGQYRIAQEISDNLEECHSESAKERYICRILEVFNDWAEVFTPIGLLQALDKVKVDNTFADLQNLEKTKIKILCTEEQVKAEKERFKGLHDQMLAMIDGAEIGSLEYYFQHWHRAYVLFCNMLAAICAEHNINLFEVQNRRGIWLVERLDVTRLQMYYGYSGNYNYANDLLKALPKPASDGLISTEKDGIISALHPSTSKRETAITDRAAKYFAKACEAGFMKQQSQDKYKWLYSPELASLAYFLREVFNPNGKQKIPYRELERIFGVSRLDSAVDRLITAKKGKQKWADNIDLLFEE